MDPSTYIENLSAPELEVEYTVRGLSSKAKDAKQILLNCLEAERVDKAIIPKNTHATGDPQREIELCLSKYTELSNATISEGPTPAIGFLTVAFTKTLHYQARTERLQRSIGETPQLTGTLSNWRRAANGCMKLWNDVMPKPPVSESGQKEIISPIAYTSSSFNEKLYTLVHTQFPNTSTNAAISASTTDPTNTGTRSAQSAYFPSTNTKPMKNTVTDFFSQIGARQNQDLFAQTFKQVEPTQYLGEPRSNTIFPNHAIHREQGRHSDQFQHPVQQFRQDNFYKLRQRWNLSFDGTESTNVHDFIYRLEHMAADDGFPEANLTKVLHLFLSKKAEDWYWVHKSTNPNATWHSMKTAILSFFSSYNFEEETKEQILQRFQSPKECFSDFALSIQKLNTRLQYRLTENQLIYRLCQNMNPALRNVTLPYQNSVTTVEELRTLCQRYERMWDQTGYDPRRFNDNNLRRRHLVNEIQMEGSSCGINQNRQKNEPFECRKELENEPRCSVEAIIHKPPDRRNFTSAQTMQLICWNCKDIGHKYQDCLREFTDIFCFGCGAANVRKPHCQNCRKITQENTRPSVMMSRGSHSGESSKVHQSTPQSLSNIRILSNHQNQSNTQ